MKVTDAHITQAKAAPLRKEAYGDATILFVALQKDVDIEVPAGAQLFYRPEKELFLKEQAEMVFNLAQTRGTYVIATNSPMILSDAIAGAAFAPAEEDELRPLRGVRLGSDTSEMSMNVLGTDAHIGKLSETKLNGWMEKEWKAGEKKELEFLLLNISGGLQRAEMRAAFHDL